MPLVCDQWALARICVRDMPDCFICVAEAERVLCALNLVVSIPALVMANNSHFAKVDGWTGWYGLVFAMNNLADRPSSALSGVLSKWDRL